MYIGLEKNVYSVYTEGGGAGLHCLNACRLLRTMRSGPSIQATTPPPPTRIKATTLNCRREKEGGGLTMQRNICIRLSKFKKSLCGILMPQWDFIYNSFLIAIFSILLEEEYFSLFLWFSWIFDVLWDVFQNF